MHPLPASERPALEKSEGAAIREGAWRDVGRLFAGFGLLYFFLLSRLPLANPDEGRYAQIPREMAATGDWVTPRLNGVPYFEKPPLVYWAVGAAQQVFGYGEWVARLVPTLCALGGVLLAYAAGRSLHGRNAGLGAALVLGTSLLYFVLARVLLLDMAVTVFMSATLVCFILGVRAPVAGAGRRRRWLFLGLYASSALATLTKGLMGFLIPGAVMFLWLLIFNQWRRLRPLYLPSGLILFLAIAAPWHVLAARGHPGWAEYYFVHEHWQRFTAPLHGRAEPWWFFGPVVLLGFFPWTGFIGCSMRELLADGWARRKANADAWFFIVWAAFIVVFFSLSQSKLIPYMLPVFPALAVLVGAWLARRWGAVPDGSAPRGVWTFAGLAALAAAVLLVMVLKPGAIRDAGQAVALRPYGVAIAAVLLAGAVAAPWVARARGAAGGIRALVTTAVIFQLAIVLAAPEFSRAGTKELAATVRERAGSADRVYHYWSFFHDFVYYAGRPVGLVSYIDELEVQFLDPAERAARFIDDAELRRQWAEPGRVWVVLRKRNLPDFEREVTRTYHLIGEGRGHYLLSNRP